MTNNDVLNATPAATVNMDMVNKVFAKIEADLEHWNQGTWSTDADSNGSICNTTFCFGGWALQIANRLAISPEYHYVFAVDEFGDRSTFSAEASKLLGFNEALAFSVFYRMEDDYPTFKAHVLARIERMGSWTQTRVDEWMNNDEE